VSLNDPNCLRDVVTYFGYIRRKIDSLLEDVRPRRPWAVAIEDMYTAPVVWTYPAELPWLAYSDIPLLSEQVTLHYSLTAVRCCIYAGDVSFRFALFEAYRKWRRGRRQRCRFSRSCLCFRRATLFPRIVSITMWLHLLISLAIRSRTIALSEGLFFWRSRKH